MYSLFNFDFPLIAPFLKSEMIGKFGKGIPHVMNTEIFKTAEWHALESALTKLFQSIALSPSYFSDPSKFKNAILPKNPQLVALPTVSFLKNAWFQEAAKTDMTLKGHIDSVVDAVQKMLPVLRANNDDQIANSLESELNN